MMIMYRSKTKDKEIKKIRERERERESRVVDDVTTTTTARQLIFNLYRYVPVWRGL
jgi:orotate phosphoribosyltransferase